MAGWMGAIPSLSERRKILEALRHRGPDDMGEWCDEPHKIWLAHRRLSIMDLSYEGKQPMHSSSGRYALTYNGEVYNHAELRKKLAGQGCCFRGRSDTEVMLAAIDRWGVETAVQHFTGMFAFALWDKNERALFLARDRVGEKPLYYGWQGKTFLFGSELKALRVHPDWQGEIDRDVLALYIRYNYVPTPHSIYKGVHKLLPGTILRLEANTIPGNLSDPQPYWQATQAAENGIRHPLRMNDAEAVDALEQVLRDTIRDKMVADVPLGAFLSGGIDSSMIVALMQAESSRPVRTFSIGFHEEAYNEAKQAKAVAECLGTEHTELYVTPKQAMDVIPRLPEIYDEPFADSSQIPVFLVSEMTKHHVTVALSGDGGDELFGGYNRYFWAAAVWNRARRIPRPVKALAAGIMRGISPQRWDQLFSMFAPLLPEGARQRLPGDKIHKLSDVLAASSSGEMYLNLVSQWKKPGDVVLRAAEPSTALMEDNGELASLDFAQRMMFMDAMTYLPDDILVKVDRAAMAVGLETRVPFLDHRIVEFAWKIPLGMKIRGGQGKWILRQALYRYVPRALIERPKMGFGVPIDAWLRGPLREWAEDMLTEQRLREEGFFNPGAIKRKWEEHLSGRRNWQHHLWAVLMFQAWLGEKKG